VRRPFCPSFIYICAFRRKRHGVEWLGLRHVHALERNSWSNAGSKFTLGRERIPPLSGDDISARHRSIWRRIGGWTSLATEGPPRRSGAHKYCGLAPAAAVGDFTAGSGQKNHVATTEYLTAFSKGADRRSLFANLPPRERDQPVQSSPCDSHQRV